uniref:GGDEF domain-containing protein n=1 Tax=Bellilinea caldifistulae TaxID=360411 RepID=A0A7C4Q1M0_9CHLR
MRSLLSIPTKQQQALVFPAVLIAFILNIFLLVYSLIAGLNFFENQISLATALLKSAYLLIFYIHFIPLLERYPERDWVILAVNTIVAVFIEFIGHLLPAGYSFTCILLMTAISSLIFGRLYAYIFLACASTAHIVTLGLNDQNIINSVFLDLFFLPLLGIATTETLLKLQSSLQFEINRQQIINKVSRSLSSSLEIHQVITMVTTAVQSALDADTYYFGLIEEDTVHLELFYDDGEFFPSMNVPIEDTLAGRVIRTRQPLLICDLPEERKKLNIDFKLVGNNKVSLSWLGVPLISGKEVLGIIAVASYQKSAFDQRDQELLENIAQRAAMALDNAYHHLEVETRSQMDSLTGVLNHNTFLTRLEQAVQTAQACGQSLSLIMLDIDHFKKYNDTHGHLTGDKVLIELTQTIRHNIKKNDLVGRWGGEEFIIALPDTQPEQAYLVAERIRSACQKIVILDRDKKVVPAPTISQGIAGIPQDTNVLEKLIDIADQRLYIAKERGRNQIQMQTPVNNSLPSKN